MVRLFTTDSSPDINNLNVDSIKWWSWGDCVIEYLGNVKYIGPPALCAALDKEDLSLIEPFGGIEIQGFVKENKIYVFDGPVFKQIACPITTNVKVVIALSGAVCIWNRSQIVLLPSINYSEYHTIKLQVIDVKAGNAHFIVWSDKGIDILGHHLIHGQCQKYQGMCTHIQEFDEINIKSIAAGGHISAVLSVEGGLYIWGSSRKGALEISSTPSMIDEDDDIECMAVGAHTIFYKTNKWHQLGMEAIPAEKLSNIINIYTKGRSIYFTMPNDAQDPHSPLS